MRSKIDVVLTRHAHKRVGKRFGVQDEPQIKRVLGQAAKEGRISKSGRDTLVKHGCLLMAGNSNGNGTLVVKTVYNLSDGISKKIKEQTENMRPTPWEECEVEVPEKLNLPLSSGSPNFSKTEPVRAFLSGKKIREWRPNHE